MPGHVKAGGSKEPDPDPTPFLYVSFEMKKEDSLKPYDPKKSVWVPDGEGGFDEAMISEVKGDMIDVKVGWEPKTFKADKVMQINPPKMEKFDDVSNMTYLNEAAVLWNLKARYVAKLIYTYSGLFCIVINPYKRYPIYTNRVVRVYIGKRRNEVPPHLFAISDGAYQQMMNNAKDQSMLITGESGAGKTENTKKVITYFAILGCNDKVKKDGAPEGPPEEKKANLEDRIVQTNPILESYGNAKTIRNDNSSRFVSVLCTIISYTKNNIRKTLYTYMYLLYKICVCIFFIIFSFFIYLFRVSLSVSTSTTWVSWLVALLMSTCLKSPV